MGASYDAHPLQIVSDSALAARRPLRKVRTRTRFGAPYASCAALPPRSTVLDHVEAD
jgi:hypothetical protein